MAFAASGDARFKQRVEYLVAELALCQNWREDRSLGGIPDADRIWQEVSRDDIRLQGFDLNDGWVPWYMLHKLFADLINAYLLCDNEQAKTA